MTSDRLFNALAAYLEPKVKKERGVFAPAETVAETLAMLAQGPGQWRCILQWQREDPTGNRGEMEMKFLVIIQQSKGLGVMPGADMMIKRANDDALLTRANQVWRWVRMITFDNPDIDKTPIAQGKTQWLTDPSFPTRQISAEFGIRYVLEPVELVHLTVPACA